MTLGPKLVFWHITRSPALPGAYNGAGAIERAHQDWLNGKIEETGIMMWLSPPMSLADKCQQLLTCLRHYVISEVDMYVIAFAVFTLCFTQLQIIWWISRGEPILVVPIPLLRGIDEDIEKLKERIHEKEHEGIVLGTKTAVSRLYETSSGAANGWRVLPQNMLHQLTTSSQARLLARSWPEETVIDWSQMTNARYRG